MQVSASLHSDFNDHQATVHTTSNLKSISIASKEDGYRSSISGEELLMLALAPCSATTDTEWL